MSRTPAPLSMNRIHLKDALHGLRTLPSGSVDLIVTDPPYNIAAKDRVTLKSGKITSTKEAWGRWDTFHPFDYDLFVLQVISECYRVLKEGGSMYMFTAREDSGWFVRLARLRGFTYRNQVVMVKKNPIPSLHKSNWRSGFEIALSLSKGKPKTFRFLSQSECVNVMAYANAVLTTEHPTEKPLPIVKRLVEVSSAEGDLVLDPFMGSGTTAVAAKALGRRFVGFETDPGYVRMARERLKRTEAPTASASSMSTNADVGVSNSPSSAARIARRVVGGA